MRNLWITALVCGAVLVGFELWYTAGGPLTEAEAAMFSARIEAAFEEGRIDRAQRDRMLEFLLTDDGEPIVMVNLVRHFERAQFPDGDRGMSGEQADSIYGRAVIPELLRRAGHPLVIARPLAGLSETTGAMPEIDFIAAVRYRSRRDLLDMATSERWRKIAEYKFAGLEYNALRPSRIRMAVPDPRLLLAVSGLVLLAAIRFARRGRRSWFAAAALCVIFAVFCVWYGGEGPLTPDEVDQLVAKLEERGGRGAFPPEQIAALRRFGGSDDGDPFYNVNLNGFYPKPRYPDGRQTDLTSREANAIYTSAAGATVLRNAGHPTLMLHPVAKLGPNGDRYEWDDINFIRYRSRRALLEMVASDAWDGVAIHKFAALKTAMTYPSAGFQVPGPRLILVGFSALLLLGCPCGRPSSRGNATR